MSGTTLTFTLDADGTRTARPLTLTSAVIAGSPQVIDGLAAT